MGCGKAVTFGNREEHLRKCPKVPWTCECGQTYLDSNLHVLTCAKSMVLCKFCNLPVLLPELEGHEQNCEFRPVSCRCGKTVKLSELSTHETSECPLRIVQCTYSTFGCPWSGRFADYKKHLVRDAVEHERFIQSIETTHNKHATCCGMRTKRKKLWRVGEKVTIQDLYTFRRVDKDHIPSNCIQYVQAEIVEIRTMDGKNGSGTKQNESSDFSCGTALRVRILKDNDAWSVWLCPRQLYARMLPSHHLQIRVSPTQIVHGCDTLDGCFVPRLNREHLCKHKRSPGIRTLGWYFW